MPGKAMVSYGNFGMEGAIYLPSVTFTTLGANASVDITVTVPGVQLYDLLGWNIVAPPAHLQIDNAYVSANNTVVFRFGTDASGVTGTTIAVILGWARMDGANLGTQALPNAVV